MTERKDNAAVKAPFEDQPWHLAAVPSMSSTSRLRRHSLLGYFALCFAIGWGGILFILTTNGFSLTASPPLETGLIFALMLLGPNGSGLILTAALDGRAGLHHLGSALIAWKLSVRWYSVALLTAPLFLCLILWPLSADIRAPISVAALCRRARRGQLRGSRVDRLCGAETIGISR
jgi:hypothetical protein